MRNKDQKMEKLYPDRGRVSKKRIAMVIVIIICLLGLAGFGLFYKNTRDNKARVSDFKQKDFGQNGENAIPESKTAENLTYYEFRPPSESNGRYTVNLPAKDRFLTTKIIGKIDDPDSDVSDYLKARRPVVDEMINTRLAGLDIDSTYDPETLSRLKSELRDKLNTVFSEDFLRNYPGQGKPIKEILITDFMVN